MSSFQTWGPSVLASRLPPTPPTFHPTYQTPANMMCEKGYFSGQCEYQARPRQTGCDFIERYSQGPSFNSQRSINLPAHLQASQIQNAQSYRKIPPYVPQLSAPYSYGQMATAPTLPPIRAQDNAFDPATTRFRAQAAQAQVPYEAKDDLPSGGVATHLDYDMDLMAEFVAEKAQGMYAIFTSEICLADVDLMRSVVPGSRPMLQFQKYVVQILSSTRLPSSTIILGLFYLASRMKIVSRESGDACPPGTVYRMLTTCLLLGSKFLDDNTFQNRSWADVSNIPVAELNRMELDWLKGFDWILHGPMHHDKEGFYVWREHWKSYEQDAQIAKARGTQKLAPLDTSVARMEYPSRHPLMSPEGPIPLQYQRHIQYDVQWPHPFTFEYSPPSATHSGPTTPDYYSSGGWSQAPPPYSTQPWSSNAAPAYIPHRSQPPSYQHTPSYFQGYPQSIWKNHGLSCTCTLCGKYAEPYFSQPTAYGIQSVVG